MSKLKIAVVLSVSILLQLLLREVWGKLSYIDFPLVVVVYIALQRDAWKALLVAGDDAQHVFTNAVGTLHRTLTGFGVSQADIGVLTADARTRETVATIENLAAQTRTLAGPAGTGCFVYMTSHGARDGGLYFKRSNTVLPPGYLDQILDRGCADRPTGPVRVNHPVVFRPICAVASLLLLRTTTMNFTTRIDQLIEDAVTKHKVKKESLTLSVLILGLTDPQFMDRAANFSRYLGQDGQLALDKRKL